MTTATIRLQGVGIRSAVEAQELQVGNQVMWNYGSITEVSRIEDVSSAFLNITWKSENGQETKRRVKKTKLVALIP